MLGRSDAKEASLGHCMMSAGPSRNWAGVTGPREHMRQTPISISPRSRGRWTAHWNRQICCTVHPVRTWAAPGGGYPHLGDPPPHLQLLCLGLSRRW